MKGKMYYLIILLFSSCATYTDIKTDNCTMYIKSNTRANYTFRESCVESVQQLEDSRIEKVIKNVGQSTGKILETAVGAAK